jgi:hypothetical protein
VGGTDTCVQPVTGYGRPVRLWPEEGIPARNGHPGPAWPEDRLIGPDHRIISRLARGQLFVWLIGRESSDAIAKGLGTVRPLEQRPGLESKAGPRRERPAGEKRLESKEQSEDQSCH